MEPVLVLIVVALVVAAIATATYVLFSARGRQVQPVLPIPNTPGSRFRPAPEATPVLRPLLESAAPAATAPLFDVEREPVAAAPRPIEIRWADQFDTRSGALDDTARLRLIGDLGVVGREWCVPILAQAYLEERRPGHRQAALIALTACHSRGAADTFARAMASGDPVERAIAADGLVDLEPAPQAKLRRTVERR